MGRKRRGFRILGPYRKGKRWQCITVEPGGARVVTSFATERRAQTWKEACCRDLGIGDRIQNALDAYERTLRIEGNLSTSIRHNLYRVGLYVDPDASIDSLRAGRIGRIMDSRLQTHARMTVKKEMIYLHKFARFVADRYPQHLSRRECDDIGKLTKIIRMRPGEGRRKAQLTYDESLRFIETAYSVGGFAGAMCLCALLLGLRRNEIRNLKCRHVDHGGRVLRVPGTKTVNADRVIAVEDPRMQALLLSVKGEPDRYLFHSDWTESGKHSRNLLRRNVQRICERAGVPVVPPHGLRGTLLTRVISMGVEPDLAAQYVGQGEGRVALGWYAQPGSKAAGDARRAQLRVINGGE